MIDKTLEYATSLIVGFGASLNTVLSKEVRRGTYLSKRGACGVAMRRGNHRPQAVKSEERRHGSTV